MAEWLGARLASGVTPVQIWSGSFYKVRLHRKTCESFREPFFNQNDEFFMRRSRIRKVYPVKTKTKKTIQVRIVIRIRKAG